MHPYQNIISPNGCASHHYGTVQVVTTQTIKDDTEQRIFYEVRYTVDDQYEVG